MILALFMLLLCFALMSQAQTNETVLPPDMQKTYAASFQTTDKATLPLPDSGISADITGLYNDTIGSTNFVYAPFYERKLTGNASKAGLLGAYNFNNNVALVGGFAHQWSPDAANNFTLSGGVQLQARIYPFKNFGWTNIYVNPFVATVIGTPLNGGNGGNLMNCNREGLYYQLYAWKFTANTLSIDGGIYYGNQTGTGSAFDGNWMGGFFAFAWDL
jgi:hypothetical protein